MTMDILQHDHRVIDQPGKGQRQTSEHHAVDGTSTHLGKKIGERGYRDREEDRQRRAHAAEEDQDHDAGEEQSDAAFVEQRGDCRLDELGLIENDVGLERGWNV